MLSFPKRADVPNTNPSIPYLENLFIVSGNSTVPTPVEVPPKTVVENKDIENTSPESDQEEEDYLKNVLLNM